MDNNIIKRKEYNETNCPVIYYCRWRSKYQERRVGTPLSGLTPPYFMPIPNQDLDFQRITSWCFLCPELRSNCLFCWYWWNCWPSLLKPGPDHTVVYSYLCNQRISPLGLWVWIPLMMRCTRYNFMWCSLSVTCDRSVVFTEYSGFLLQ